MRDGPSRVRARRPWHARAEARLAAVVVALLAVAGGAAVAQATRADPGPPAVVAVPAPPTATTASTASTVPTPAPSALATAGSTAPASTEAAAEPTAGGGGTGAPTATVTTTPAPSPTPSATPTPEPVLIDLRPERVGLGETMLVWVRARGASAVTLDFLGNAYRLIEEQGVFWGVVGVPLDAEPGTATLTVTPLDAAGAVLPDAAAGDEGEIEAQYEIVPVERPVDYVTLTAEEASVLTPEAAVRERELRAEIFSQFDRGRRWAGLFQTPTEGIITTQFGQGRSYNGGPVGSFHSGVDFAAPEGSAVTAAASGRVAWVGEMPIRGLSLILDHGSGVKTGYHHLSSVDVAPGDEVRAGERIAAIGASGLATGPHLHWELTVWGVNVDPFGWTLHDFTP